MKILFACLADHASADQFGNKLSVIGRFPDLGVLYGYRNDDQSGRGFQSIGPVQAVAEEDRHHFIGIEPATEDAMTQQDLRALLQRYTLRRGEDPSAPAGYQFWAYYSELPGCVAQAESPEAAIAELDVLMRHYLDSALSGNGSLPVPLVDRNLTQRLSIGPIFVGELSDFASGSRSAVGTSETHLEARSSIQRRNMESVALN